MQEIFQEKIASYGSEDMYLISLCFYE